MSQIFFRGHRVKIAADLGPSMSHFESNCEAVIVGSYRDLHGPGGGGYAVVILRDGQPNRWCAWYYEHQLALIDSDRDRGEALLQQYSDTAEREMFE